VNQRLILSEQKRINLFERYRVTDNITKEELSPIFHTAEEGLKWLKE